MYCQLICSLYRNKVSFHRKAPTPIFVWLHTLRVKAYTNIDIGALLCYLLHSLYYVHVHNDSICIIRLQMRLAKDSL